MTERLETGSLVVFLAILSPCLAFSEDFIQKDVPSISQRVGMNSNMFCGPAAVVNTLAWLKQTRKLNILRGIRNDDQLVSFVNRLGSDKYMKTDNRTGTSLAGMVSGLSKYLNECAVPHQIETRCWFQNTDVPNTITFAWLSDALKGNKCVIINIGWYHKDEAQKKYLRNGGHYITGVGYHVDGQLRQLVFNDPLRTDKGTMSEILAIDDGWSVLGRKPQPEANEIPMLLKGVESDLGKFAIIENVMVYTVK